MPCDQCPHCRAPRVLRLPQQRRAGDHLAYDARLLAAYEAARELTSQPQRLLREINPWLSGSQLRDQLVRARTRGAQAAVNPDMAQRLLDHSAFTYLQRAGQWPCAEDVQLWGLAADEESAVALLATARKMHARAHASPST